MDFESFTNTIETIGFISLWVAGGVAACVLGVLYVQNKEKK